MWFIASGRPEKFGRPVLFESSEMNTRQQIQSVMLSVFLLALPAFSAQQVINIGAVPNDGTGDSLRAAFGKVNTNFTELYDNVTAIGQIGTNNLTQLASIPLMISHVVTNSLTFASVYNQWNGGLFQWVPNDPAGTNAWECFASSSGAAGRWRRLNAENPLVTWWGAIPNDALDDTAAIQQAINDTGKGLVPPGLFYISGLTITNNQVLKGAGRYSTEFLPYTNTLPLIQVGSGTGGQYEQYMELSGFSIGPYAGALFDAPCAIRINGALMSHIHDFSIRGGTRNGIEMVVSNQIISHLRITDFEINFPRGAALYTDDSAKFGENYLHVQIEGMEIQSWNATNSFGMLLNGGSLYIANSHLQSTPNIDGTNYHGIKVTRRTGLDFEQFVADCDNHSDVLLDLTYIPSTGKYTLFDYLIEGSFTIAGFARFPGGELFDIGSYVSSFRNKPWLHNAWVENSIFIGDVNDDSPTLYNKLTSLRRIYGAGETNMTIVGNLRAVDRLSIGDSYPNSAFRLESLWGQTRFRNGTNPIDRTYVEFSKPGTSPAAGTNAGYIFVNGDDYAGTQLNSPSRMTLEASDALTNGLALSSTYADGIVKLYAGGSSDSQHYGFGIDKNGTLWPKEPIFTTGWTITNAIGKIRNNSNAELEIDSGYSDSGTSGSLIWFKRHGTNLWAIHNSASKSLSFQRYTDGTIDGVFVDSPIVINPTTGFLTLVKQMDTQAGYTRIRGGDAVDVLYVGAGGLVGIGGIPTLHLSTRGNSASQLWGVERHTTADTAGVSLTLKAGGATALATDKSGGVLILESGQSTGTGSSPVDVYVHPPGATGTADTTRSRAARFHPSGALSINNTTDPGAGGLQLAGPLLGVTDLQVLESITTPPITIAGTEVDFATGSLFDRGTLSGNTTITFANTANGRGGVVWLNGNGFQPTFSAVTKWMVNGGAHPTAHASEKEAWAFLTMSGVTYGWKMNYDAPTGGGSGGHTIEEDGTPLTARTGLNFVGAGITATDDAGGDETDITLDADLTDLADGTLSAAAIDGAITRDTEWDTIGEIETAVSGANILVETEIDGSGELAALMDDELGTGLYTLSIRTVEAKTAAYPVVSGDSYKVFTNEGEAAKRNFTLPSAAAGLQFVFINQDTDGMTITAVGDDTIRIAGTGSASAGNIDSTTVGSTVTLVAINATEWVAISALGTWAVN